MTPSNLGPFDYKLDPPPQVEQLMCDACNGSGKIGCSNFCDGTQAERDLCRKYHRCNLCSGYGYLTASPQDFRDAKADVDFDTRRDMRRGI